MSTARRPLATPQEVAAYRRITVPSLAQERYKGEGPPFKKLGRHVRYDWDEVYAWVDARTASGTAGAA